MSYYIVFLSDKAPQALRGIFPFMKDGVQYYFFCEEYAFKMNPETITVPARVHLSDGGAVHWQETDVEITLTYDLIHYWVRVGAPPSTRFLPMAAVAQGINTEEAQFLGVMGRAPIESSDKAKRFFQGSTDWRG